MELYVHIPFCARKCRYCDFASYAGREADMAAYVSALHAEADETAARCKMRGFTTVFLGGRHAVAAPRTAADDAIDGSAQPL